MPGYINHTNEIMVLLGENYFVKRSSFQAKEIVGRRQECKLWTLHDHITIPMLIILVLLLPSFIDLEENIQRLEVQMQQFQQRLELQDNLQGRKQGSQVSNNVQFVTYSHDWPIHLIRRRITLRFWKITFLEMRNLGNKKAVRKDSGSASSFPFSLLPSSFLPWSSSLLPSFSLFLLFSFSSQQTKLNSPYLSTSPARRKNRQRES